MPRIHFGVSPPVSPGHPLVYSWDPEIDPTLQFNLILKAANREFPGRLVGCVYSYQIKGILDGPEYLPRGITWRDGILQLCRTCARTVDDTEAAIYCSPQCKIEHIHSQ